MTRHLPVLAATVRAAHAAVPRRTVPPPVLAAAVRCVGAAEQAYGLAAMHRRPAA